MNVEQSAKESTISVRNIGGIDETSVVVSPGVTVLEGENATNRTSLLQAIMAALGSDNVSMKGDADEAFVELELDGETYTRKLSHRGNTISTDGDPYLDDPALADLFAFLLESNEARRAVTTNSDFRDLIMRPVDTEEIRAEIDDLVERRRDVEDDLEELASLKERLPSLEEQRAQLRTEIEETKANLAAKEEQLEAHDTDVEQTREEKAELEDALETLRSTRSDLEDIRYDLQTERDSLESARAERRELEAKLDDLLETPMGEVDELESRIEQFRQRKLDIESDIDEIQSVIRFNRDMLAESDDVLEGLEEPTDDITDELLADDVVTCWTCGSEVSSEQIETTVDQLRELSQTKLDDVRDIESELADLDERVTELREQQQQREQLQQRRSEIEAQIDHSESAIEGFTDRREELQQEIEALEAEIEELEDESYEEVLELHRTANQFEYDLGRLEGELEDVEAEITDIEDRLDNEASLKAQRNDLAEEIHDARTKIERIEQQAIEEFNDHMDVVLEILGYDNLERIWLERVEKRVRDGRQKATQSGFELHIVRQTDSGATYEDSVEHLSESEREVTGLIFALAGYLAHEVYETVPFMLLDSLEAIDSNRIATLVDHLREYSSYLVVALLPEDAGALDDQYQYVNHI